MKVVMAARARYQNQRKVKIFSEMMFGARKQR